MNKRRSSDKPSDRPSSSGAKKPYRAPRLIVYGDLREITKAKGGSKGDGGGNPATKV